MNIALLFDAYHPAYQPNYYRAARRVILETGIVQRSNRHMKLSTGDVLIPTGTRAERDAMREAVYFEHGWGLRHASRLRRTYERAEVMAMMFENMPKSVAQDLHEQLSADAGYLGLISVDFAYGPHLALFRNSLIGVYRLKGAIARALYSMGSKDGYDPDEIEAMRGLGFTDVGWEDKGARKTIFDDFDTLTHFVQVARFRRAVTPFLPGGEDGAFELVMVLEDLNPQLFNALGAAVNAIESAEHEEHVAQAALSGRRYLEKLADALFPARAELYNGKDVSRDKYKNRLWAFIGDNLESGDPALAALGAEIDRLVEELNGGLHGDRPKERVLKALADSAQLTGTLLALNPEAARQPYAPFLEGMRRFLNKSLGQP